MKGIYKITSPSGKVYIGQTIDFERRLKNYKNIEANKGQRKLYSSLKKYGFDRHLFELVEQIEDDQILNSREKFHYDFYKSIGVKLLNIMEPGGIGHRYHCSESKKLIGDKNKKGKVSQFTKEGKFVKVWNYLSEIPININNIRAAIIKENSLCNGYLWRKGEILHDISPYRYISKGGGGSKKGRIIYNPVYQYDLEGNFIKEWRSMNYASLELHLNKNCISSVSRGVTKQTGGFKWSKNKVENLFDNVN